MPEVKEKYSLKKLRERRRASGLCISCGYAVTDVRHERHILASRMADRRRRRRDLLRAWRKMPGCRKPVSMEIRPREFVNKLKVEQGCQRCHERHPACLEFHHREPKQKLFNMSQQLALEVPWPQFWAEVRKCDVLCSNCHRKHHWEVSNGPVPAREGED